MFGAISASHLMDYAKSTGAYYQQELDLGCPKFYFIKPEYLSSVPEALSYYDSKGLKYSSFSTVDHPSFTKLRNHLEKEKLISVERSYSNGDRVLEYFFLNNCLMKPGDKFLCACAFGCKKEFTENYNNGEIDTNYKMER